VLFYLNVNKTHLTRTSQGVCMAANDLCKCFLLNKYVKHVNLNAKAFIPLSLSDTNVRTGNYACMY